MTTNHQPRIVLIRDEYAAYAREHGWTSVRKQAKALGLDHSALGAATNARATVGAKFMAHLIAHAVRNGHAPGTAFERFFAVRGTRELSAAA